MKLEVNVGELDSTILKWYDNANPIDITNALYHGYNIVSNPQFNKHLETTSDSKLDMIQEENTMLKQKLEMYTKEIDTMTNEIKQKCSLEYSERLKDKEQRIEELREQFITSISDKERLIKEINERIDVQKKVQITLENDIIKANEKCVELESIMNNSYKKGDYAENKLKEMLDKNISKNMTINLISKEAHKTDIHIKNKDDNGVILVESKFYNDKSKTIISGEIKKFKDDIDSCKSDLDVMSAIFISNTCDIPAITKDFRCINEKGMRCYYFANMTEEKFKLLYQIIEIEHIFFKAQKISEGNESMNKFLMRCFIDISVNYERIESLTPGYSEIKKAIDKEERRYNKQIKKIMEDIRLVSNSFTKLTNIDSVNSIDVTDLLNIETPHLLNIPQWHNIKDELIRFRVEKNELIKTREERDSLKVNLDERDQKIKELETKVEAKVAKKPRGKKKEVKS
jgi:hypothetical protein